MKKTAMLAIVCLGLGATARAQDPGAPPDPQVTPPPPSPPAVAAGRSVSWPQLVPNIVDDQKQIWTFPARLSHDRGFTRGLAAQPLLPE